MALSVRFTFWKVEIYPYDCVRANAKENALKTLYKRRGEKSLPCKALLGQKALHV